MLVYISSDSYRTRSVAGLGFPLAFYDRSIEILKLYHIIEGTIIQWITGRDGLKSMSRDFGELY